MLTIKYNNNSPALLDITDYSLLSSLTNVHHTKQPISAYEQIVKFCKCYWPDKIKVQDPGGTSHQNLETQLVKKGWLAASWGYVLYIDPIFRQTGNELLFQFILIRSQTISPIFL